jgi:gliding motility-associated-like protein
MRAIRILFFLLVCFLCSLAGVTQLPIYWQKSIGGSDNDNRAIMQITPDGGYIVLGNCRSSDGNINMTGHGGTEVTVMKMDSCGIVQWQKKYGGSKDDFAYSLELAPDGGYVFGGMTNSNDGDVSGLHGSAFDWWVVKLDVNGDIQWKKTIGGSVTDVGGFLTVHPNGNVVVVGSTASEDGDLAGVPGPGTGSGVSDGWIVCLSTTGNILWQKKYGTARTDQLSHVIIAPDGTIVAAGSTTVNLAAPPSLQHPNAWVIKMDANGNLLWSKTFGGTKSEGVYSIVSNGSGELIAAGLATSSDGDLTVNYGDQDSWVFKLSPDGSLLWQLSLGGAGMDRSWDIAVLPDQTVLLCGETQSDSPFLTQYGQGDAFFAGISDAGQLLWKQNYGGSLPEVLFNVKILPDGNYMASGISGSSDHDLTHNYGLADLWLIKFKYKPVMIIDTAVCYPATINNISVLNDTVITVTVKDVCGYDSVIKKYTVDVTRPVVQSIRDTSIVMGNAITLVTASTGVITWDTDPTLSCLNCNDPVATPVTDARYIVTAQMGICTAKDTVNVAVRKKEEFYVPNAFSPNGDGLNDNFKPSGYVQNFYMQVFNRWGNLVFSSRDISKGWNGIYQGKPQPVGLYIYVISYTDGITGKEFFLKGNIVLVK